MDFKEQLTWESNGVLYEGKSFHAFELIGRRGPNTPENFGRAIQSTGGVQVEHHSFFGYIEKLSELPGRLYFLGMTDVKVYLFNGNDYYVVGLSPAGFLAGYQVRKVGSHTIHE